MIRYFIISILLSPFIASAAVTMNFSPVVGDFVVQESVPVKVIVRTGDADVNAIGGKIIFDPKYVEVERIDQSNSFLTSWTVAPTANNDIGSVVFEGLMSGTSSYRGERGEVFTLFVKGKVAEEAALRFDSGSAVRASDGTGNNLLEELGKVSYRFVPKGGVQSDGVGAGTESAVSSDQQQKTDAPSPSQGEVLGASTGTPAIMSSSHPDQSLWSSLPEAKFQITPFTETSSVSISFNKRENAQGNTVFPVTTRERIIKDLEDGVWYFHYTQQLQSGATTTHYKVLVDRTPPSLFEMREIDRTSTDPTIKLFVAATDTMSGIEKVEFVIGDSAPIMWKDTGDRTFTTKLESYGSYVVHGIAYDKAGNKKEAELTVQVDSLELPKLKPFADKLIERTPLLVAGTAVPDGTIRIELSRDGKETIVESGTVDSGGNFTFETNHKLEPGEYKISAVVQDNKGGLSKRTDPITIVVESTIVGMLKRHPLIPIALIILIFSSIALWMVFRFVQKRRSHDLLEQDEMLDTEQIDHASAVPQSHVVRAQPVRAVQATKLQPARPTAVPSVAVATHHEKAKVSGHVISLR